MSETKLKPCPFCGGPAAAHKQFDGFGQIKGWWVGCNTRKCPVYVMTRVKKDKSKVIADWNNRA